MSRGDVLARLVGLRLVADADAFLFLALRLVLDAFLFLVERLLLLERPRPVWAYLCARCIACIFAAFAPSRARALAACLTLLPARTSPSKLTPLVRAMFPRAFAPLFIIGWRSFQDYETNRRDRGPLAHILFAMNFL